MKLTIVDRQILKDIPSASGITLAGNDLYVIGDNSPWIFKLNTQYQIAEKFPLISGNTDSIIPKQLKPDFESIAAIQWKDSTEILVFGSGSRSPERDILLRFNPADSNKTRQYSLEKFYSLIKSTSELDDNTLNIEAAAISGDQLFLLNRGKNILFQLALHNFISFLEGTGKLTEIKKYEIQLPDLDNTTATFSGASFIPNTHEIIFTASVENNQNTMDDGKISGSFVGIIHTDDLKNHYKPECILITENKKTLKIKVESVEVLSRDKTGQVALLLVTDSDGGVSEVIRANLNPK